MVEDGVLVGKVDIEPVDISPFLGAHPLATPAPGCCQHRALWCQELLLAGLVRVPTRWMFLGPVACVAPPMI